MEFAIIPSPSPSIALGVGCSDVHDWLNKDEEDV
jgi:hypothetical protein